MGSLRNFECVCGYLLGEIYRDAKRITQLRVYRFAVSPEDIVVLDAVADRVKFVMEGVNDGAVICSHCGSSMAWFANQSALDDMMRRRRDLRRQNDAEFYK